MLQNAVGPIVVCLLFVYVKTPKCVTVHNKTLFYVSLITNKRQSDVYISKMQQSA